MHDGRVRSVARGRWCIGGACQEWALQRGVRSTWVRRPGRVLIRFFRRAQSPSRCVGMGGTALPGTRPINWVDGQANDQTGGYSPGHNCIVGSAAFVVAQSLGHLHG